MISGHTTVDMMTSNDTLCKTVNESVKFVNYTDVFAAILVSESWTLAVVAEY